MKSWENIVKTATVGTNRIPYQTTDLEIWQEALVQGKQNEEALLQLAGAHAIARRAGYVPKKTKVTLPETAEEEELEYVFAGANQYFKNDDIASFNLFISELVRNKRIIQPLLLPQLFETATRFRSDPETIMQVAGKRGQWFLQFYPKAAYFKDVMEVDWETGTLKNRLRFAQKLRQTDPNKARELIEAVISEESIINVQKFLMILDSNLSKEDVSFLTSFLKHKNKSVRFIAAGFLAMIPETELHQQTQDLGDELLVLKKSKLKVELPEDFLEQVKKYPNLSGKVWASNKELGEKSKFLSEIISYINPTHWKEHFKKTPTEIFALGEKTLFTQALIVGWAMAAIKYKNPNWAAVLITYSSKRNKVYFKWIEPMLSNLIQIVEKDKLQEILINALNKETQLDGESSAFLILSNLQETLEVETTKVFFEQLKKSLTKSKEHFSLTRLFANLKKMAKIFPVEILPYLQENWKSDVFGKLEKYEKQFNEMYYILEFRQRMLKNIKGI